MSMWRSMEQTLEQQRPMMGMQKQQHLEGGCRIRYAAAIPKEDKWIMR